MYFLEILLLAVGLSMDSLVASTAGGAVLQRYSLRCVMKIAGIMALFQAGFTLIGFLLGSGFEQYIKAFDHWIAFGLLLYLGARMIYEGVSDKKAGEKHFDPMCNKTLVGMSIATSIDALAIGVSLALLDSPIWPPVITIGAVTFLMAAFGVYFGHHFGGKMRINLNVLGGIILISIGVKILTEHLFFC